MSVLEIERQAKQIADGSHDAISPGQPYRISEAATVGDEVWQGDLGIVIAEGLPSGYEAKQLVQLVPGSTVGAKHCLADGGTADVFVPEGFGESYEGINGPYLRCKSDTEITHPKHGNVTIPAGMEVQIRYQREWDLEQKRERRNAD